MMERLVPGVNRRYGEGSAALRQHLVRYRFACAYVRNGDSVLDAACGSGYGSFLLAEHGASVTALDRDPQTIQDASKTYAHPRVNWVSSEVEKFVAPDRHFHRIVSLETIEHLVDPARVLGQFATWLRADGVLIVSSPVIPTQHIDPYHLHDFERSSFLGLLENAGLRVLDFLEQEGTFLTVVAALGEAPDLEPRPVPPRFSLEIKP